MQFRPVCFLGMIFDGTVTPQSCFSSSSFFFFLVLFCFGFFFCFVLFCFVLFFNFKYTIETQLRSFYFNFFHKTMASVVFAFL